MALRARALNDATSKKTSKMNQEQPIRYIA